MLSKVWNVAILSVLLRKVQYKLWFSDSIRKCLNIVELETIPDDYILSFIHKVLAPYSDSEQTCDNEVEDVSDVNGFHLKSFSSTELILPLSRKSSSGHANWLGPTGGDEYRNRLGPETEQHQLYESHIHQDCDSQFMTVNIRCHRADK